jgi:hypothetical protein
MVDIDCTNRAEEQVLNKWSKFLKRLQGLNIAPELFYAVHNKHDKLSCWDTADLIYQTLSPLQYGSHFDLQVLDIPGSMNSGHNYWDLTFTRERLAQLLCGSGERLQDTTQKLRQLKCHSPGCTYLVHPEPRFGGFCCKMCHYNSMPDADSNSKYSHWKYYQRHGPFCKKIIASSDCEVADGHPPDDPIRKSKA